MFSTLKIEEISQNCWCCQVQKLRKSRRIVDAVKSSSKIEDVSQNCFVFDAVKFKH